MVPNLAFVGGLVVDSRSSKFHVADIIVELEKIQRRAARWVMNDYGRLSSVT